MQVQRLVRSMHNIAVDKAANNKGVSNEGKEYSV